MESLFNLDLQPLLDHKSDLCISIYLPTYKKGAETQQNFIRFKNLIQQVQDNLSDRGLGEKDIDALLQPAYELLDDRENYFWEHQDLGLGVFCSSNFWQTYRLPTSFEEMAIVADHFYIKPLMRFINLNQPFYLLALSQNEVRLFKGNRHDIKSMELDDMPSSLAEALRYDDPEKQLQFHSGSSGGNSQPIYHGHGVGTTDNKDEIQRYFQAIDSGLMSLLPVDKHTPLMLAGVDYLISMFQDISSYPNLVKDAIIGNPETLLPQELHEQALPILHKALNHKQQESIEEYQEKQGIGEASDHLSKILTAAYNGQIDTLMLAENEEKWGQFDPNNYELDIHSERSLQSNDLLELAAFHTVKQGGEVYLMDKNTLPNNSSAAAIFRYPVVNYGVKVTN
ncbi:baeRF7 domain-containing protein [Crocosphaera chwakensis]|uniref:Uncharacterized protein n=1 Tax=Crocosphaera chwakensis CCY0110 TaxID=391612 RepID=A3IX28_9CHRO|nr:hypothetical protein [Crocosphaera chwakensis]EAZ88970.1 hypothetical protein CY0110_11002 [Crocosphaera chwakensis CCY0110]